METGKDWIHRNGFDRLSMKQLVMPGSHDSGTYYLDLNSKSSDPNFPKFLNKTVRNWAKTQNLTIYDQLCHGVRYLDFRVKRENGKLKLIHGLTAIRLETAFEDILRFSIEQPEEHLIIDCNHIYTDDIPETTICLEIENVAIRYFDHRLVRTTNGINSVENAPLNTLGGRIWLFTTRPQFYFGSGDIRSWWANTYTAEELVEFVEGTVFDESRLNVSQFILTIQPKTVVKSYLNPFNRDNLEYFVMNELSPQVIQDLLISLRGKSVNVILVDFIENVPEILNWCITTNSIKLDGLNRNGAAQ